MKSKLNEYLDSIDGFDDLSFKAQVKALCYFQAGNENNIFTPSDILTLFDFADCQAPSNIHQYFSDLSRDEFLNKKKNGYNLTRKAFKISPLLKQSHKSQMVHLTEEERQHNKAIELFEMLEMHSEIRKASRTLFADTHYPQAIFEAFKKVNNMVKKKSGRKDLDGKSLMTTAFSKNKPILKLNNLITDSDRDEQEGYMHLFAGAIQGIRNPKAHDEIVHDNPLTALKLLCLASLLAYKVDESKKST